AEARPARASRRRPLALAEVGDHLARGTLARVDCSVRVPLEVGRRGPAAEVRVALLSALDPREGGVLADLPVGVRPARPRIPGPEVERGLPVPELREARQDGLDLTEELLRPRRRRAGAEARADRAAGVVDEDPGLPRLRARDLPRVLVPTVGVRLARAAEARPVPARELHVELRVRPHSELGDRLQLAAREARLGEVDRAPQD